MPKKPKDAANAEPLPIYSASHEEQVDLLAQALLREYMHRKKFSGTLATFDEECPRNEKTVSSRAVMGDLMHLNQEKIAEMKAKELNSFMEMMCQDRVAKQSNEKQVREMIQAVQEPLPEVPTLPKLEELEDDETQEATDSNVPSPASTATSADGGEKKAKKEKKNKKSKEEKNAGADEGDKKTKAKKEKKEKKVKKEKSGGGGFSIDDLLDSETPASAVRPESENTPAPATTSIRRAPAAKKPEVVSNDQSDSSTDSESDKDEGNGAAGSSASPPRPKKAQQGWGGSFVEEEDEDKKASPGPQKMALSSSEIIQQEEDEKRKANLHAAGQNTNPQAPVRNWKEIPIPEGAIGVDMARKLRSNFVGNDRRFPDSFIRQGFHRSQHIEYGLVQNEGGPCGVLAVIQGRMLAELRRRSFIITKESFPVLLAQVLAQTLQLSSQGRSVTVVVPTVESGVELNLEDVKSVGFQVQMIARLVTKEFSTANGTTELEAFLLTLLQLPEGVEENVEAIAASTPAGSWAVPSGIGMTCFMFSQVFTRNMATTMRDMDVESTLIVEHGYCSQELTNLALCGRAVSNVHNGTIKQGDFEMKGFPQGSMDVGFLSALEVSQLLTVGTYGKKPTNPVWVIYNESHYTVLFSKESNSTVTAEMMEKCLEEGGSTHVTEFDLYYYDQQGQEEEIKLSVRCDSMPIPAARKGMLIPYLNTIIRTMPQWKYGKVDWNGTDPLL